MIQQHEHICKPCINLIWMGPIRCIGVEILHCHHQLAEYHYGISWPKRPPSMEMHLAWKHWVCMVERQLLDPQWHGAFGQNPESEGNTRSSSDRAAPVSRMHSSKQPTSWVKSSVVPEVIVSPCYGNSVWQCWQWNHMKPIFSYNMEHNHSWVPRSTHVSRIQFLCIQRSLKRGSFHFSHFQIPCSQCCNMVTWNLSRHWLGWMMNISIQNGIKIPPRNHHAASKR